MEEKVSFRVTAAQKRQLRRLAEMSNKTVSDYARDAALSLTLDAAKTEFYQSILEDLAHIKKGQYVMTKLLLLIGSEQMGSQDAVMGYYREAVEEAESRY